MSSPTGIGRGMTYLAWILALALLTLFFSKTLEQQRNPNRELGTGSDASGAQTVVLERNRRGHYVATAAINGQAVEVMLDTGATRVSVPETLARRLGLKRGHAVATSTANGMVTTYDTVLDSVQLGNIRLHGVKANINPHHDQVLLGMSFLKQLEFTQRGDTLVLKSYH